MNIGDESNKVANSRIKDAESGCGISLRVWRVGKISDRFQTDHGGDLVAARFASASVNKTSHLLTQKIRRLLVHKRHEAQRVFVTMFGRNGAPMRASQQRRCHCHWRRASRRPNRNARR